MVRSTDRPAMTIAVDLGRRATNKQTNKSTTIKVSWAGQDLACIETVLPLRWRSAMQYIATVSMPGTKPNHGLTMVSTLIASRWSRPQFQILSYLC